MEYDAHFELIRGAVIAGSVVDHLGEPIDGVQVSVRPIHSATERRNVRDIAQGPTDDRGKFRLAGLSPGVYSVTARGNAPGLPRETLTVQVEVDESQQFDGLTITFGGRARFRVSGVLVGVRTENLGRARIRLEGAEGSDRDFSSIVGDDGTFRFRRVIEGRYVASAVVGREGSSRHRRHFLGLIHVRSNIEGLTLQPAATAALRGTLENAAKAASPLRLLFTSTEGHGSRWLRVRGGEAHFELEGLVPGSYRIEARSSEVYVKGIRRQGKISSAEEVDLSSGPNRLDILIAADYSQIYGTVREPGTKRPLPHARVALDSDNGKISVQADQSAHFRFEKVMPGEYRICAWADMLIEDVEYETNWEEAGCANKIIPVEPESQVEIDLTAAL